MSRGVDKAKPSKARSGKSIEQDKAAQPVKAKTMGNTWWGQRWIEALERSSRDVVARLGRGRAYARDGHVQGLQIRPGKVSATVNATINDDELESFGVSLNLEVFDGKTWQQIMQAMSQQALFAAQLLNGEMPRDIDRLFRSYGKSLFPANSHEIDADCSCDDWSSPCKHVAAVHYVLGEALDGDPFLLFELRGRSKEQVLSGLNHLRAQHGATLIAAAPPMERLASSNAVALSELATDNFEHGASELPMLSFNFDLAPGAGALLRSLGKPPSWNITESPQELLGPALLLARELACDLANGSRALPCTANGLKTNDTKLKTRVRRKSNNDKS